MPLKSSSPPTTAFTFSPTLASFDVSVKDYLATHPEKDHVVVGALVFFSSPENKVLILQRSPTDFMPHLWETPGGGTDHNETVLEGATRELREESGLLAKKVRRKIGEYEFIISGEIWWKVSFEVEVEGFDVKLDEAEHQAFLWASEEECRNGVAIRGEEKIVLEWTSQAQLDVILEGFRLKRAERD